MMNSGNAADTTASVEEIQRGWRDLTLRVAQLEAEKSALEREQKALRLMLERAVEHRQKSHTELVLLLTGLISKLPINDIGGIVSKLVEHNTWENQFFTALMKGSADANMPQPTVLKTLDQTKRDLVAALKPLVEELIQLDTPLENEMLQSLTTKPELFFSPAMVRANRCFVKGHVPKERIAREFGEQALAFFDDMTTDPKRNPHPKPAEIVLGFKNDFEASLQQDSTLTPDKRQKLMALYQKVQRSKAPTEQAHAQKAAFQKLSFIIELLHYYEHQNTEASDVIFAQRLPALVEQLVFTGVHDKLEEKSILLVESLLAHVINPDHRQVIVNNIGKGGSEAKTLKYVLTLRAEKVPDPDQVIAEFLKHLISSAHHKAPSPAVIADIVRLISPTMQRMVTKAIMTSDRLRKDEAEALGRAVGEALGLKGLDEELKAQEAVPPEVERQLAWAKIKDLIVQRNEPATIAATIRDRLNAKYSADEIRQSWITLTEADPMSFIKIFCHMPYLPNGQTDPVARAAMETYAIRLMHEKYAATYKKVANSLRSMFAAKPDSPTLLNFMALVRWVSPDAANKLCTDIGMPIPAQ